MKKGLTVLAFTLVILISACGKEESTRFTSEMIGADNMEIITDTETDLVWVNDTRGCFAGIVTPGSQCADLTFAGKSDWRTPTAAEMSNLIKGVVDAEISLNYINSSCANMSTSENKWVFTENSSDPGGMTTNMPGNAGLRCVSSK